jgi:aldose sugar dehydrogenase
MSRPTVIHRLLLAAAAVSMGAVLAGAASTMFQPRPPGVPASSVPSASQAAAPRVETVVTGLRAPWAIDFAPDGRWFVTERGGQIRVVEGGRLLPEPWLTIDVREQGEAGLLGLALDPDFATNGYIYVAYGYRDGDRALNRLVRLREDPATRTGVLDRVLLDAIPGAFVHDGGRVKVGPDGKLYWTMGDNPQNPAVAQDPTSMKGVIFRLERDGTIPADNPLPGSPVFAYGLRNSQGLAWQPGTGRLYATDHGPSGATGCCRDEVNLIEAGRNYGWPLVSGDETREGAVPPVVHSGTSITWAPAGAAFVTSGPWAGSLVFTALRGQSLFRLVPDAADPGRAASLERLFEGEFGRLRDVVEGPDGALYILTSNRDGRGQPAPDDDRILRLTVAP